mmetsp:Transcript_8093/g.11249  ORF Transcript_8093/g.11249 Transcript_8093/m.11249 type:complete len:81 (-) Transcript_8093:581-823(-)
MQGDNVTSSSLLLAHAHFAFLFKEFLAKDSILASPTGVFKRSRQQAEFGEAANAHTSSEDAPDLERIVSLDEESSPQPLR